MHICALFPLESFSLPVWQLPHLQQQGGTDELSEEEELELIAELEDDEDRDELEEEDEDDELDELLEEEGIFSLLIIVWSALLVAAFYTSVYAE